MEGLTDAGHEFRIDKRKLLDLFREKETEYKNDIAKLGKWMQECIDKDDLVGAKMHREKQKELEAGLVKLPELPVVVTFQFVPSEILDSHRSPAKEQKVQDTFVVATPTDEYWSWLDFVTK